jgi:hypothetical protein
LKLLTGGIRPTGIHFCDGIEAVAIEETDLRSAIILGANHMACVGSEPFAYMSADQKHVL